MTDARFTEQEWQDNDGERFAVVIANDDLDGVWVDGNPRNVSKDETLVFSGSDTVGYYSFNADQYREWGCAPVDDAPTAPTPEPSESAPDDQGQG